MLSNAMFLSICTPAIRACAYILYVYYAKLCEDNDMLSSVMYIYM